jgi:quercetin dioxygenase-like cupin family protein
MQSATPPAPGTSIIWGGFGTYFKVAGETTRGAYAIVEHTLAPGVLAAPLHRHSHEDELSYVLEGELTAQLGDQIVTAPVGTYVPKPRGQFHTFWNAAKTLLRFIEIISPSGFENYFAELAKLISPERQPDMEKLIALQQQFGLEMDMDSLPRLMAQHNLHQE